MPIKTKPTGDIPFLLSYQPFELPLGIESIDNINDMISFNFEEPTTSPIINYNIGSLREDFVNLIIKNITRETTLQVFLEYDPHVFTIRERDTNIEPRSIQVLSQPVTTPERKIESTPITLRGETSAAFMIKYNKQILNAYTDNATFSTSIRARIQNIFDGKMCTRNVAVKLLNKERFQPNITVT